MTELLSARVDEEFLKEVDREAERRGLTRSEYVRETMKRELAETPDTDWYTATARGLAVVESVGLILVVWPILPLYIFPGFFGGDLGSSLLLLLPPLIGGVLLALVLGAAVALVSFYGVSRASSGSRVVYLLRRLLR
jgi:hypothetical protein